MGQSSAEAIGGRWIGQTMRGKYRILRLIGEGGWGSIYEAEHQLLRRRVAIKVLHGNTATDTRLAERFRREAMAASQIGHPNIIEVLDLDRTDDGTEFMVLELLSGSDLERVLDLHGRLPVPRVLRVFRQIGSALAAAHRAGIVHRDLKPGNVFLVQSARHDDFVKILDFGIAKLTSAMSQESLGSITHTGTILGTPYYMSPEQLAGDSALDHRTDVYALGVMLYEALTGRPPFEADNLPSLVTKVMSVTPAPVASLRADVPLELSNLVARMMAKAPGDRPSSCDDVVDVLDRIASRPAGSDLDSVDDVTLVGAAPDLSGEPFVGGPVDGDADDDERTTLMHGRVDSNENAVTVEDPPSTSGARPVPPSVRRAPPDVHPPAVIIDLEAPAPPPSSLRRPPDEATMKVATQASPFPAPRATPSRNASPLATTLLATAAIVTTFTIVATIAYYVFRQF